MWSQINRKISTYVWPLLSYHFPLGQQFWGNTCLLVPYSGSLFYQDAQVQQKEQDDQDGERDKVLDFVVSHGQCTWFNAGITGMTCGDVAETSLSDLAGLAQYCSRRARLQLLKQHSSTIPRFWERRLFDLLVGRPAEIQMKIMSSRHCRIVLVTFQTKSLSYVIIYSLLILNLCYKPLFCPCNTNSLGTNIFLDSIDFVAWTIPEFFKISRSSEKLYAVLEGHERG